FHELDIQMPPMVSRLSFTYVDHRLEKMLETYGLSIEKVINNGLKAERMNWVTSFQDPPIDKMFQQLKQTISDVHEPIKDIAYNRRAEIGQLADKKFYQLQSTVDHLKKRMLNAVDDKYDKPLSDFTTLENYLPPQNGLQERMWNILPLINTHGTEFVATLV